MQAKRIRPVSGHVFVREGARGAVWYAKWRDQHGQHQRRLGPVWPGPRRAARGLVPAPHARRPAAGRRHGGARGAAD
jgi:hypothetical protein